MEERITMQLKGSKPQELRELNLDNVPASKLNGLEKFTSLKKLTAINVGLTTLEGLPALSTLETLNLGDNKLSGGLECLYDCPSLHQLSLVGNKISKMEDLQPLCKLTKLVSLDLLDCPVTQTENYRENVFELLPGLEALDGLSKDGEEVESDDESEEEEEEGEEPGLDYLQKDLDSEDSSEEDYNPDNDEASNEDLPLSSDEEGGPSASKKPRVEPESPSDSED